MITRFFSVLPGSHTTSGLSPTPLQRFLTLDRIFATRDLPLPLQMFPGDQLVITRFVMRSGFRPIFPCFPVLLSAPSLLFHSRIDFTETCSIEATVRLLLFHFSSDFFRFRSPCQKKPWLAPPLAQPAGLPLTRERKHQAPESRHGPSFTLPTSQDLILFSGLCLSSFPSLFFT